VPHARIGWTKPTVEREQEVRDRNETVMADNVSDRERGTSRSQISGMPR